MIQIKLWKLLKSSLFCSGSFATPRIPSIYCQFSRQFSFPGTMSGGRNSLLPRASGNRRETVQVVKMCQELGIGPGGFYQPGYNDGAKLRLQMMCLGQDWDPQTRRYQNQRRIDGSKPPAIPPDFISLVEKAMQDSHAFIEENYGVSNEEYIFPHMSPDVCIVNFYTTRGRLGLHQDRDESKESLIKGLPVVSFSVGDSAEFLYGEHRDLQKAENVLLESGDVLIFGGKSRHIFHGVLSIIPDSAPPALFKEAKLRPGRLNLTFRQY